MARASILAQFRIVRSTVALRRFAVFWSRYPIETDGRPHELRVIMEGGLPLNNLHTTC